MLPDWLVDLIKPRPTCVLQLELLWPDLQVIQQAALLEQIKKVQYGQWLFHPIWTLASKSPSGYLRYRALEYLQHNHKEGGDRLKTDACPLVRSLKSLQQPSSIMQPQRFWAQLQLDRLQLLAQHPSPILLERLLTYAADHQLNQQRTVSETELASLILEVMPGMLRFSRDNLAQAAGYMGEPLFNAFQDLWRLIPLLPGRAGYELLNRLPWQLDGRSLAHAKDLQKFRSLLKWGLEARLEKEYTKLPHELMKGLLCHPITLEDPLIEYWTETVQWDLSQEDIQCMQQLPASLKKQRLRLLNLHAPFEVSPAESMLGAD